MRTALSMASLRHIGDFVDIFTRSCFGFASVFEAHFYALMSMYCVEIAFDRARFPSCHSMPSTGMPEAVILFFQLLRFAGHLVREESIMLSL